MESLRIAIITETLPRARLNLQPWRYLGDLAGALRREGHDVLIVAAEAGMREWNGVPVEPEADRGVFRSGRRLHEILQAKGLDGGLFRLTAGLFFSMRQQSFHHPAHGRLAGIFLRPIHSGADLARRFLDPDLAPEIPLDRHHAAMYLSRRLGIWPDSLSYVDEYLFLWDSDRQSALAAGLPADACSVIRHPFDPSYLARAPSSLGARLSGEIQPVPRRVVFAGPPEESRGVSDAVRAVRMLPPDHPTQLVSLLRDPDVQGLAVSKARYGPHEVITVRGLVSRTELQAVYQTSHVAVFPYRFVRTALPLVALEAVAAGLPVVTTRVHPLRELEGGTGLLFAEPRSPRSIASAIGSALEAGERAEIDRRNREWIAATPNWQDVARSVVSALRP